MSSSTSCTSKYSDDQPCIIIDSSRSQFDDDCCLLPNVCWHRERISYYFRCRFQANSVRTSFDFKSFLPEQLSDNIKICPSSLQFYPITFDIIESNEQNATSDESEEEIELTSSPKLCTYDNDDFLNKLVEWKSDNHQPVDESDDDEAMNEQVERTMETDPLSAEKLTTDVEDLFVTYSCCPVKSEPVIPDDIDVIFPQLDGQNDSLSDRTSVDRQLNNQNKKRVTSNVINRKNVKRSRRKPDSLRQITLESFNFVITEQKATTTKPLTFTDDIPLSLRSGKSLSNKRKKRTPLVHTGKTIRDYFHVNNSSTHQDNLRAASNAKDLMDHSESESDECIIIDEDDDISTLLTFDPSIPNNIRAREKLLDHSVHSSSVPFNQPIRYSDHSEQEFSFYQFSLTSHLRYLLHELPTYNHTGDINCNQCDEYVSILHELFDLLFDFIEYDLCGMVNKMKYRSSLIEDDYFNDFVKQKFVKTRNINAFFRIKLVIYFIELIEIHRRKCSNTKPFVFHHTENRVFQWIEDSIRHIVCQNDNFTNHKLSLCFNVMELCVLFANEQNYRTKQMARFLAELYQDNQTCLKMCVLDENLLIDIRLLLINELIWKRFEIKLHSIDRINEFFRSVQETDPDSLLLARSLLFTFADLVNEMESFTFPFPVFLKKIITILRCQLDGIYSQLTNLCEQTKDDEELQRSKLLFRLLCLKWKTLHLSDCFVPVN
ncbi:unnamed protein product [Adineta ricciae]|uniref:Uncharacterized protein n=1 Tax=Adineta ricciae TaxID=249248 RepID=A0A813VB23_ADIRI|nr:unnamed protein product [Adineta ricciae]